MINSKILMQRGGFCEKMLWSHTAFVSYIFKIVFNKGHCISQWGSTFWPEYKEVGTLHHLLLNVPFYITLATIPPTMTSDLKEILHLSKDCLVLRWSNDHHNVVFCVQKMCQPSNLYQDLTFLSQQVVNWVTLPLRSSCFSTIKRRWRVLASF